MHAIRGDGVSIADWAAIATLAVAGATLSVAISNLRVTKKYSEKMDASGRQSADRLVVVANQTAQLGAIMERLEMLANHSALREGLNAVADMTHALSRLIGGVAMMKTTADRVDGTLESLRAVQSAAVRLTAFVPVTDTERAAFENVSLSYLAAAEEINADHRLFSEAAVQRVFDACMTAREATDVIGKRIGMRNHGIRERLWGDDSRATS